MFTILTFLSILWIQFLGSIGRGIHGVTRSLPTRPEATKIHTAPVAQITSQNSNRIVQINVITILDCLLYSYTDQL